MNDRLCWKGIQNSPLLIFTFIIVINIGCQRENIDIPDTGRKIVINGLITTDTVLNAFLSRSNYLLDISGTGSEYMRDLDSMEVSIYENNVKIDSLSHYRYYDYDPWKILNFGNYRSVKEYPSVGKEYKIVAKGRDLPEATAKTIIPDMVGIEGVDTSRIILAPGTYYEFNTGLLCRIEFSDPSDKMNYYLLRIRLNTYWRPYNNYYIPYRSEDMYFYCTDPIIEEKLYNINGLLAVSLSDKIINGQKHKLDIVIKGESIGEPLIDIDFSTSSYTEHHKTLYIKLYSITEEFFRYIQTLQLYSRNYSNPLAEPVLMESNVTGGYGMFSGASVSTDSIVFNLY